MLHLTRRPRLLAVLAGLVAAADLVAGVAIEARPDAIAGVGTALRPSTVHVAPVRPAAAPAAPVAIESVTPSRPTAFTLTGPRFTIRAHVCAMPDVRPYDPPGEQHHTVCWVRSGFGSAPGSATGTSYLFGHSWAPDPQEVLNAASSTATAEVLSGRPRQVPSIRPGTGGIVAPSKTTIVHPVHALDGYRLVLRTRTGVLTYQVRSVYGVAKDQLGYIAEWQDESVRNRIVLTTCAERGGVDYDYNVVIEAYLVKARSIA